MYFILLQKEQFLNKEGKMPHLGIAITIFQFRQKKVKKRKGHFHIQKKINEK